MPIDATASLPWANEIATVDSSSPIQTDSLVLSTISQDSEDSSCSSSIHSADISDLEVKESCHYAFHLNVYIIMLISNDLISRVNSLKILLVKKRTTKRY